MIKEVVLQYGMKTVDRIHHLSLYKRHQFPKNSFAMKIKVELYFSRLNWFTRYTVN